MPALKEKITVGSRVTIATEAELRGEISIGTGTVIHPKATILAVQGPIVIGRNCIIEELAVILNRGPGTMKIGDENLFEVGCRIESPKMGDHNTFEPRSKVDQTVLLGSFSTIGAACTLTSGIHSKTNSNYRNQDEQQIGSDELDEILSFSDPAVAEEQKEVVETTASSSSTLDPSSDPDPTPSSDDSATTTSAPPLDRKQRKEESEFEPEQMPDNLVIYGMDSRARIWSGEGVKQAAALHAKHLSYLQDSIPKFHKLKIIDNL